MKSFLAILLLISAVQGFTPASWYNCPNTCNTGRCRCASVNSPLPLSETPQFVVMTNDDIVDQSVVSRMGKITSSGKNRNGCPIPVTWFANAQWSNCKLIKQRYLAGDEFAVHNYHHKQLNPDTSQAIFVKEILGCRQFLVKQCGLPLTSVRGYRSTYLVSNPETRKFLYDSGFIYDSSLGFDYAGESHRPWPYTMNYGNPDTSCGNCKSSERLDGFWEVPVWPIRYDGQTYSMDPGMHTDYSDAQERPVFNVLKSALDSTMKGNKAPLGVYVHEYWITPKHSAGARQFIQYATSKGAYFVTMRQLVEWMKHPVPKSKMDAWLRNRCG